MTTTSPEFGGTTYDEPRDRDRLRRQLDAVRNAMTSPTSPGRTPDGWWTLAELAYVVEAPQASVSARLRDLRKAKHGGHTVERRYVADGLWEYRLTLRVEQ